MLRDICEEEVLQTKATLKATCAVAKDPPYTEGPPCLVQWSAVIFMKLW